MKSSVGAAMFAALSAWLVGCEKPVYFPAESLPAKASAVGAHAAYDTRKSGTADFYMFTDGSGRVNRLGYDQDGRGKALDHVELDRLDLRNVRHLVIILDGFGFDVVNDYYRSGRLRVFYPPSRVIAPYPTLTDLCLEDALGYVTCNGFEAEYYDHQRQKIVGGVGDYLAGKGEPCCDLLGYRASMLWDGISYVAPWSVYGKEINDTKRTFDKNRSMELIAYLVSSAGVGTTQGADGQRRCLERVEQLVNQVIYETRGLVKITMFADHGHSYTHGTRIGLEEHLQARGWRLVEKLRKPKDVAYIRFGLETYASFATRERAGLAADLMQAQGVELASYVEGDGVVVLGKGGQKATIRHSQGGFSYQPQNGDPLKYKDVLAKLKADDKGFYLEEDLFQATLLHEYPSALQRLWRAHFGLVYDPADVIVSLENGYYSGSKTLDKFLDVASTHGSLNRVNSTTFIMSTAGPLPPAMRSMDIPRNLGKVLGRKFPAGK